MMRPLLPLALALVLLSCDKAPPLPYEPPPSKTADPTPREPDLLNVLKIDAGDLADDSPLVDPPSATGNLQADISSFTTIENCVAQHAKLDPIIGDAIDAIGYESFVHDACRILQAAKARDTTACREISVSTLRARCETTVAVVTSDGLSCPMNGPNHDPFCLALARRDTRLCAMASFDQRKLCQASLAKSPTACGRDPRCIRISSRWKSILPDPSQRPELGSKVSAVLVEITDGEVAKPLQLDLSKIVMPATVVKTVAGNSIRLGEANTAPWPSARIAIEPRFSLRMNASADVIKQGSHPALAQDFELTLLIPYQGTFKSVPSETPPTINVDLLNLDISAPVRFTLEIVVADENRSYRLTLTVNSFVRDVLSTGAAP